MPLASDALMPSTSAIFSAGSLSSLAQAAAAAMLPTVPVECQPPSFDSRGLARMSRAATSAPTMSAVTQSAGEAPVLSASGRSAGITGEIDWPLRNVKS
jgi:hypothetical protein